MSSLRGGRGNARGTGFTLPQNGNGQRQPRVGFQTRGGPQFGLARGASGRGGGGGAVRGASRGRGAAAAARGTLQKQATQPATPSTGDYNSRFQQLKTRRENERKDAIKNGFLADPDRPRTLAEAITPVGTCPDMCAEFERLERIVQKDVWSNETREDGSPDEARMVKKFRRAAAGIDEQLPSDLRPPQTLKKTCDYLFDTLIGSAESLGTVHHFVWDRTRAIRNDFSIQQITRPSDVEIAIDCYERIARFHILSLHQFAVPEKPYDKYDWFQEREQLDRTLLSLMQYYEDHRDRVSIKNEAEFRAYCIIFQIQDPIPDLEDRISCFPPPIKTHPRVRTSLDLYAAACNILDPQGPLKPRGPHPIAREDWDAFFKKVESHQVSYLMACVAEIYFNMLRKQALNAIWRSFRRQGSSADITDFSLDYLTDLLRFDDFDQTRDFCEHYGFGFADTTDGQDEYLDLNSVQGKTFPEAGQGLSVQIFSQSVVENKRMGRTFSSVIDGKSFGVAKSEGQIVEEEMTGYDAEMQMDNEEDSLFVPMNGPSTSQPGQNTAQQPTVSNSIFSAKSATTSSNPFGTATSNSVAKERPNTANDGAATPPGSPFAQSKGSGLQDSVFAKPSPFSAFGKPSNASPWAKPVATDASTTNSKNASIFAPPAQADPTNQFEQQKSQTPNSPTKTGFTSMHAPSNFAWSKPSTSSWSTPVSSAAAAPQSAPAMTSEAPTAAGLSQSIFAKPASNQNTSVFSQAVQEQQKALPSFNFAKPAAAEQKQTDQPAAKFSFATAGIKETSAVPEKSMSPFGFTSASQTTTKAQTASSFNFTSPTAQAPQATSMSGQSVLPQEPQQQKSIFNFAPQSAPPPAITPKSTSTEPALPKAAAFSPPETSVATNTATKPFSFTPSGQQQQTPTVAFAQQKPSFQQAASPQSQSQASQSPLQPQSPPSLRRSPSFSNPSQPKKRSPLSQSFTIEEDQPKTANSATAFNFDTPPKQQAPIFAEPHSSFKPQTTVNNTTTAKPVDPQTIFTRLATEIITDPVYGLLRQFVEYHARPVIMSVYEDLYAEEMRNLADTFRTEKLAKKYGRKWRETTWRLRLARQGKEKREKRRNARRSRVVADEAGRRRAETDAVDDYLKRQSVRMHQASVNGGSPAPSLAATSRRSSIVSHPITATTLADTVGQQNGRYPMDVRGKASVTTRVDSSGRVMKPATPAPATGSSARKSHFLGFSVPKQRSILGGDTPRQSTRSAYFRMKALGLNTAGSVTSTPTGPSPLNIKKRGRDDDESELATVSPPAKRTRSPQQDLMPPPSRRRSSSDASRSSALELSPGASTIASTRMSRLDLREGDVLARARAARQAFRESTQSHRTGDGRPGVTTVMETPVRSIQQARFRAVDRAEQNLAQSVSRPDVPAYRFRESRFVPRAKYALAIEKAKENMERRSRAASVHSSKDEDPSTPQIAASRRLSTPRSVEGEMTQVETELIEGKSRDIESLGRSRSPSVRPASPKMVVDEAVTSKPAAADDQQMEDAGGEVLNEPVSEQSNLQATTSPPATARDAVLDVTAQAELRPNAIPMYQPPPQPASIRFGFGQYNPPPPAGVASVPDWSFSTLESAAQPCVHASQAGSGPLSAFDGHLDTMQDQAVSAYGMIDTQTISDSPYLHLSDESQPTAGGHFSMYPTLQGPRGGEITDVRIEHDHFIPDLMDHQEEQFLSNAARVALAMDSSVPEDPYQQESIEQQYLSLGHDSDDMVDDNRAARESYPRDESRIDPSLLESADTSRVVQVDEVRDQVATETEPREPKVETKKSRSSRQAPLVVKNPFAALGSLPSDSDESIDSEDEDDPASSSAGGEDEEEEGEEEEDHHDEDEGETSILRQPDDDTFIPNGIIQDSLARLQEAEGSDMQDAQRSPQAGTLPSFTSTTAPAEEEETVQSISASASSPANGDTIPPRSAKKTRGSAPPQPLKLYRAPHTRSKSRELSAPPPPSSATRDSVGRERERESSSVSRSVSRGEVSSPPGSGRRGGAVAKELAAVEEREDEDEGGDHQDEEEEEEAEEEEDEESEHGKNEENEEEEEEAAKVKAREEDRVVSREVIEDLEDEDGEDEDMEDGDEGEVVDGVEDGDEEEEMETEDDAELPTAVSTQTLDPRSRLEDEGEDVTEDVSQEEGVSEMDEDAQSSTRSRSLASGRDIGLDSDEEQEGSFDEDEGSYDEDEEDYDEDEDEAAYHNGHAARALTPGQMQDSGLIKGGTGQTADDAFELSD